MIYEILIYRKPLKTNFNIGSTLYDQSYEGDIRGVDDIINLFKQAMIKVESSLSDKIREGFLVMNSSVSFFNLILMMAEEGIHFNIFKMEDRNDIVNQLDGKDRIYLTTTNAITELIQFPIVKNARTMIYNEQEDAIIESLIKLVNKYTTPDLYKASGLEIINDSLKTQKEMDDTLPYTNFDIFDVMNKLGYDYLIIKDLS